MSTIREIIARVDDAKINAFSDDLKVAWIAELDGKVALDVMLMSIEDAQQLQYKNPEDLDSTPLVKFPHDSVYDLWLSAKIDFANGEYSKYQNSMEMFNAHYGNYVRWFAEFYEPAQGYPQNWRCGNNPPYYIDAYALAVSRGFKGTLDEWLASLVGKKISIHYDGQKILWKWCRGDEEGASPEEGEDWTELINVEELRGMRPYIGENGNWWIGEDDLGVKAAGEPGAPGYVPVKGEDYFTEEDILSMKEHFASAGHGLGAVNKIEYRRLADQRKSGWYSFDDGSTIDGQLITSAVVRVDAIDENNCYQTMKTGVPIFTLQRGRKNGTLYAWEWENPPYVNGIEYPTTKRYNGKKVYTKRIEIGAITGGFGSVKSVAHNITGNVKFTSIRCVARDYIDSYIGYRTFEFSYNGHPADYTMVEPKDGFSVFVEGKDVLIATFYGGAESADVYLEYVK